MWINEPSFAGCGEFSAREAGFVNSEARELSDKRAATRAGADPVPRHAKGLPEGVRREAKRLHILLSENFAGMSAQSGHDGSPNDSPRLRRDPGRLLSR